VGIGQVEGDGSDKRVAAGSATKPLPVGSGNLRANRQGVGSVGKVADARKPNRI